MIGNVDGVNNDYVAGWLMDPAAPERRLHLDVVYNGRKLIRATAGFWRPELLKKKMGDGYHGFYVALPPLSADESAEIKVLEAASQKQIGKTMHVDRKPVLSAGKLMAADMLSLLRTPLFSVEGFGLLGPMPTLTIAGMHLPYQGDPFALQIRGEPGVVFEAKRAILRPGVRDWYWFWPNAAWSGYSISVDLLATRHQGPDFEFALEVPGTDPLRSALKFNHIWIPKDLSSFQNFPVGDKLTRVHTFDNPLRVAIGGYTDFRRIQVIAAHYGLDLKGAAVLDWGCGHGRAIRHFVQQGAVREGWGVDIDKENVGWLREHLPQVNASVVPLMPPTSLPSRHFDLIFAISVMTHLKRDVQEAWLKELKRIAKPGGLVLLTFAGEGSAAFTSRFLKKDWMDRWQKSGFDDSLPSKDLVGKIDDPTYYTNTKQTGANIREFWGKHFEILDIHECAFGYQDLAVMRVPGAPSSPARKKATAKGRGKA